MIELDLKAIELDILLFIDAKCRTHGLQYFLCGGTLLGAVRHHGFIPWDDDIDIMMPRSDYNLLIQLLEDQAGRYKVLKPNQPGYYYNYAKIVDSKTTLIEHGCELIPDMGVFVDVFPIEGLPTDESSRLKQYRKLHALKKKINSYAHMGYPLLRKNLLAYMQDWYLYLYQKSHELFILQKRYSELANLYTVEESQYMYISGGRYGVRDIFASEIIQTETTLSFEGHFFKAPAKYDTYLKQLYGDYMKLPPKEKQISLHDFDAYYAEK